jgi:triacylglycerol lipase
MSNPLTQLTPIVLVHGIFGFGHLSAFGISLPDYFRGIPAALRAQLHVVPPPPSLNPAGSIAQRANDLKNYLNSQPLVLNQKVHLIAHSMGGLDARYMIAKLGMADRVLSLTTIGTPHHGSPVADAILSGGLANLDVALGHLGLNVAGAKDLATAAAAKFNKEVPEVDGIRYQSIAGVFHPQRLPGIPLPGIPLPSIPLGLLGGTHDLVERSEGPNDGLVSVASARSGQDATKWNFRGTWDGSHFRLVNWGNDIMLNPIELGDQGIVNNYVQLVVAILAGQ